MRREVAIIGGSLAGAACAITLERAGLDVITLDRVRFPRGKVCGGFLSPGAVRCLDELGMLGAVRAAGAAPVETVSIAYGGGTLEVGIGGPALAVSRGRLDAVMAARASVEEGVAARIEPLARGFRLHGEGPAFESGIECDVVVNAAGAFNRFAAAAASGLYGVQFLTTRSEPGRMQFGFYEWGYGGTVSVEDGWTNECYLVNRAGLDRFRHRSDCKVTAMPPFRSRTGPIIAIGDAAGMVDPFLGEGMRRSLESGRLAAGAIVEGLRAGRPYGAIRDRWEREWRRSFGSPRVASAALRGLVMHRPVGRAAFRAFQVRPRLVEALLERVWA